MAIQSVSKAPLNSYINNLNANRLNANRAQRPQNIANDVAQSGQTAGNNTSSAPVTSSRTADRVELSAQAKALSAQRNTGNVRNNVQASSSDAGRAAYVQAIKQQVQSGTYTVDNAKLANAVMKDVLNNMG
ncbi:MAG: flagellar biosynthesis anti-sigma factor FlgM [Dissulfuribacterales bacterium]